MLLEKKQEGLVIELRGVEFENKGAKLMLYSILEKIKAKWPAAIFVMEHTGRAPRKKQLKLGIYTKTKIRCSRFNLGHFFRLVPKLIRRRLRLINEEEVSLILDGSGFAFGDFWGPQKAERRLASHIVKWKEEGKKVVLLPQAMGSFKDQSLRKKMILILKEADLIFPRDEYSLGYVQDLNTGGDKVFQMPDFTNILEGKLPTYYKPTGKEVFIIPNNKLIESGVLEEQSYMNFLYKVIEISQKKQFFPVFLIHAGKNDCLIAEKVNKKYFHNEIKIIAEDDPILIKGIIKRGYAVVTSRYHGLVSSLSQSVPSLTLGWSHKYLALLKDYNCSEALITKTIVEDGGLVDKMNWLLDSTSNINSRKKLADASEIQKRFTMQMWEKIFDLFPQENKKNL